MSRSVVLPLSALSWLLLAALPAAGEETPVGGSPTWFARALVQSPEGLNVTYFWSKGARLRSETVVLGHKVVTIVNGPSYYAYDATLGRGVALERTPEARAADDPARRPFGRELEAVLEHGAEKVREEDLQGMLCDVFRLTDRRGRRDIWVLQEGQLPVRLEFFDRARGSRMRTDYTDWQSQLAIEDDFFQPEPFVTLEAMSVEEYARRSGNQGKVGPVPIFYADLLTGGRREEP